MSTFYFNRSSGENINSQWVRHLQTQSYIGDIDGIVSQNRKELQSALQSASAEHKQAMQQICGTLDYGFSEVGRYLQEINCNISELRGEINEMAAMLDWKLSLLIEEQRLTNQLLGHIAQLLRIPDSQKQRVYHIEQGLKYFKNAILEGANSSFYEDSMESFKEAERIERKDYIILNRIGQIYLYSQQYMDIALAEQYFLRSAREAFAEANASGTTTSNELIPRGHRPSIYSTDPFKVATAEAYLYAGRACYLQEKVSAAAEHAGRAYTLIPEFVEAGFEQAKYIAANNQEADAVVILETVITKDRYFSLKTLADADLASKRSVLSLLGDFQANVISRAQQECDRCLGMMSRKSKAGDMVEEAAGHLSKNSFLSGMKALDLLNADYNLPFKLNRKEGEGILRRVTTPSLKPTEFIKKENESSNHFEELMEEVQKQIIISRVFGFGCGGAGIGFVVGFFRGCTIRTFSMDGETWLGTLAVCALVGAVFGLVVGWASSPRIKEE